MVIIASKARLASVPPAAIPSVSTRGVICQEMPQRSLHQPHSLSCPPLPTMAFQLIGQLRRHRLDTGELDRKSTRLNSSHANISYAVFCLKKKRKSEYLN